MKLLLLGANGQVGFELARALQTLGEVVPATRDGKRPSGTHCLRVDLADPDTLTATLDQLLPDVVVNAAAYTAVDRAEDEGASAQRANGDAVGEIGAWAARNGALVVHYSTDYVFDGAGRTPYREDAPTAPLGAYGRSKLAGETALQASGARHLIFRTAWVYAARGGNFVRTMLRLGAERGAVRVVADQRGAPTGARLIADVTAAVLHAQRASRGAAPLGTFHLAAGGECSWYDFAQAIFAAAAAANLLPRPVEVTAIPSAEFPTKARRPAYSVLDTQKLRDAFGLHLPPWQEGLDAVIAELAGATERAR